MTKEKATINSQEAAEILGCSRYSLYLMARDHPEKLGFPVMFVGNRLKIPRKPFMAFLGLDE